MGVNFLELIAGTGVDLSGLEKGLDKAEELVAEKAKDITKNMSAIGLGIATGIAGAVVVAIEQAIQKTAEWGREMADLSDRMGTTVRETASLVNTMARFGVSAEAGAHAMQLLSSEVRQTQNALDPFETRLGKTLGSLRDLNGQALNMNQVFELVRQRISGAATDSEKLQVATQLLGSRIGGNLVSALKVSNEEWEKQKASVEASLGPVERAAEQALAYKTATEQLSQGIRGLEISLGTKLLPQLTNITNGIAWLVTTYNSLSSENSKLSAVLKELNPFHMIGEGAKDATASVDFLLEKMGIVSAGTTKAFLNMDSEQSAAAKAAEEERKKLEAAKSTADEIELTEQMEKRIVATSREYVSLLKQAYDYSLSGVDSRTRQLALDNELNKLEEQRVKLASQLTGLTGDQRIEAETKLLKNRVEAAKAVSDFALEGYREQEQALKANGIVGLQNEIKMQEARLSDERIVGSERLKIEADLYQKRRDYAEQVVKTSVELGFASIDEEIAYRKQKMAELLGKGDPLGAAQELVKAQDLAIKQADEVFEFTKKLRVVSIQDEISYQKQKLEMVKGNAAEEMKVLSTIADLDKDLYNRRVQFALDYNQKAIDSYNEMRKATGESDSVGVHGKDESVTFAERAREAERSRFEQTRNLRYLARQGGTDQEIAQGTTVAQSAMKDLEEMMSTGKEASAGAKDLAAAAQEFLKAKSGGEEVRAPGGPSPVVGSLLSPAEGLATGALARGSDIPRLDTSFTDLAIRIRDALLGTIPNLQNFSNQLAITIRQMAQLSGIPNNPGIIGPGGGTTANPTQGSAPFGNASSTPAPTSGPGTQQPVQPTSQVGVGPTSQLSGKLDNLITTLATLPDRITSTLQDQQTANAQSIQDAINQVLSSRQGVDVKIGIDDRTGDLIVTRLVQEISGP